MGVRRHRAVTGGAVRTRIPLLPEGARARATVAPMADAVAAALWTGAAGERNRPRVAVDDLRLRMDIR